VNADVKHKLIQRYEVTDAAVHESQKLDGPLTKGNIGGGVRRQCLSLDRDRGGNFEPAAPEPYSSARHSQRPAVGCASESDGAKFVSASNTCSELKRPTRPFQMLERIAAA
jgi:hypothetical protein